jgi:ribosome maturation factor RimP
MPLKLHRQYVKNIGRDVDVRTVGSERIEGTLTAVEEDAIVLDVPVRQEGSKSRKVMVVSRTVPFTDIASTRIVVSFKPMKTKQFNPSNP